MPYAKNGDINIYYEVEGKGPPLVLLHGISGGVGTWREFGYVDALKGDYRVIIIDARGHGKSDKPHDPESYKVEQRVGDVTAVMDDLGINSAHIFGFSYGGRIGLEIAKLAPERASSLIIGGMGPEDWNLVDPNPELQLFEAGPEALLALFERSGPISAARKARILGNDYKAIIAIYKSPLPDMEDDLPGMTMPFLVFVGEADNTTSHEKLKEVYSVLPDITFFSLPGLDHPQSWSRSDLVLPHIKEFLARVNK